MGSGGSEPGKSSCCCCSEPMFYCCARGGGGNLRRGHAGGLGSERRALVTGGSVGHEAVFARHGCWAAGDGWRIVGLCKRPARTRTRQGRRHGTLRAAKELAELRRRHQTHDHLLLETPSSFFIHARRPLGGVCPFHCRLDSLDSLQRPHRRPC